MSLVDRSGEQFRDLRLDGATFGNVSLRGATFRGVDLAGARFRGVELVDVDISGEVLRLHVNGVDVVPLVEAELDRRQPERALMRPVDADGFRRAWAALAALWDGTVERARGLPASALDERVDGEWSFLQTLRHLAFATDTWVSRVVLDDPYPWHRLELPWEEMDDDTVPFDRDARPSLAEVLELRTSRFERAGSLIAGLADGDLDRLTACVRAPGWREARSLPVRDCLRVVLNEEWEHRSYAERDLAVLASRG